MHLFTEIEIKEPSVSTILMNFENKFDPYGAMSTPLYQTATFKQVLLKGKQLYVFVLQMMREVKSVCVMLVKF